MDDRTSDSTCRSTLANAVRSVVAYGGRAAFESEGRLRSMLSDAVGQQGRRCRSEVELLITAATTGNGITELVDGTDLSDHINAVTIRSGCDPSDAEWAVRAWVDALSPETTASPARPVASVDATLLPVGPTVLPGVRRDQPTELPSSFPQPPTAPDPVGSPAMEGPTPTSPSDSSGDMGRRLVIGGVALVTAVLVVGMGAFFWLQRDNGPGPANSTNGTAVTGITVAPSATESTAAESVTEWLAPSPPDAEQQELLDQQEAMFAPADTCRPITDDDPDPLGTYPRDQDEATLECVYEGDRKIVYSLFSDDAVMRSFFDIRLDVRKLERGEGQIGPVPPWEMEYSDDADRGTGSIFGYQRSGEGARSEVGFIREGASIYAYSYQLGTDFAGYYTWWADIFGGPAPPS